jgi:hypothetical protein
MRVPNVILTVNDEVLRPLLRSLYEASQSLLVFSYRPAVELLRVRLPHYHVHKILVPSEGIAVAHKRKQFGSMFDFDGSRKHIAIAVLSLSSNEKVAGDLIVLDPDVGSSHCLPLVDWAIFLVQSTKVPR